MQQGVPVHEPDLLSALGTHQRRGGSVRGAERECRGGPSTKISHPWIGAAVTRPHLWPIENMSQNAVGRVEDVVRTGEPDKEFGRDRRIAEIESRARGAVQDRD